MKSPSELLRFGLGPVIIVLIVGISGAMANKHKNVEFGKDYAAIYPEAQISADDTESLNGVLKKYDKKIYRIQKYHKGRLVKTDGELSEKYMRDGLISEVKKEAKATKFTGWAIQAGVVADKTSSTHPTPGDGSGQTSSTHPTPGDGSGQTSSTHPTPGDGSGQTSSTHPSPGAAVDAEAGSSTHPSPSAGPSASPPDAGSSTHPTPGGSPGEGAGSSTHPSPSPSASAGSSTKAKAELTSSTKKLVEESEAMLKEVRPILEKYNKDTKE